MPRGRSGGHVGQRELQTNETVLATLQSLGSAKLAAFQPQKVSCVYEFPFYGCSTCYAELVQHHQLVQLCAAAVGRGLELLRSAAYPADKANETTAVCLLIESLKSCCDRPWAGKQDPQRMLLFAKEVTSSGEQRLQEAGKTLQPDICNVCMFCLMHISCAVL